MGKRYSVAVDFDGVLHSYTSPWVAAHVIPDPPVDGAIEWLDLIGEDFDIVIFTTRAKTWRGRRAVRRWLYDEAYYLRDHNIRITAKKPPCLIYLDDRAYRFEGPGTFPTADQIHRARPWNKPAGGCTKVPGHARVKAVHGGGPTVWAVCECGWEGDLRDFDDHTTPSPELRRDQLLKLVTEVIDGEMGFQSVEEVRQFLAAGLRAGRV